jgi:hypothetical protein
MSASGHGPVNILEGTREDTGHNKPFFQGIFENNVLSIPKLRGFLQYF